MQKRIRIFPYKQGSQSARAFAQGLNVLRINIGNSRFIPRSNDVVINWGSTACSYSKGTIINPAQAVHLASNKLLTFRRLSSSFQGNLSSSPNEFDAPIPTPQWTERKEQAQEWVAQGSKVYGRQTLTGTQGQGIIIFNSDNPVVTSCPLYTKATKAKVEYRVHVVNGRVIDCVQKKKRLDFDGGIHGIRNHANGWVFARNEVVVPESVQQAAVRAVRSLSLDFGAVDIGYTPEGEETFVYEVNTAPGLEGTTLERYIQAFKEEYCVRDRTESTANR
jgi:hypothetical protein